ncbi:MAG: hypothetical protein KDK53_17620 [Maritimibacter sp.]|nr:hypothetical protein [Maritimibacter sp.]
MDTLPDFGTYDIFRRPDRAPDLDRIEAALKRSEKVALGLTARFPENQVFAEYLDSTRRGLAALPDARAALAADDLQRLDDIAAKLAGLFTTQGKADRLADWGLLPD